MHPLSDKVVRYIVENKALSRTRRRKATAR
jgi:hypothetical protein